MTDNSTSIKYVLHIKDENGKWTNPPVTIKPGLYMPYVFFSKKAATMARDTVREKLPDSEIRLLKITTKEVP